MSQIPARQRASILAVVFTLLLVACGQSQSAASTPQAFSVVAKEFAFAPAALTVKAGQPVTINLQNTGAVEHDWSVREIEISGEAKSNGDASSGHTMGGMGDEPKRAVTARTGHTGTQPVTPSKPRTDEYYHTVA